MATNARNSDPETSHEAGEHAESTFAGDHRAAILGALILHGPAGKDLIGQRCRLHGVAVSRRLSELERAGLAETTGELVESLSGRSERVWRAVALEFPA